MSRVAETATAETLPGLLLDRANLTPAGQALRHHHLGIWEPRSWRVLADETRDVGNGLFDFGVKAGDVVGLVATNQPMWIAADLAIQGLGAITLAIDPGFSPGTVVTLMQTHAASTVVVGNQEQYDKVMDSVHLLPLLQRVVVIETRGIAEFNPASGEMVTARTINDKSVITLAELQQRGGRVNDAWTPSATSLDTTTPCTVEAHLDRSQSVATLRAHSATSHELIAAADELATRLGAHAGDELYPIASFADPVERLLSLAMMLRVGAVLNIGEGGLLQSLEVRSVQPTIAHLPASLLKGIREDVQRRQAKRGLRHVAVGRLLDGEGTKSVSALTDRRVTFGMLSALAVGSIVVHRLLVDQHGLIRLAIIAAMSLVVGAVLVFGGFAVRPFVRRAYGLGAAHSLLTSPDIDADTQRFLGALKLTPILEQRVPQPNSSARPTS